MNETFMPTQIGTVTVGSKEVPVTYKTVPAGHINLNKGSVALQGTFVVPKENIPSGNYEVVFSVGMSEAFTRFNTSGELVAAVKIVLNPDTPATWETFPGEIRVESGRLQIANPDYQDNVESIMAEQNIDDFFTFENMLNQQVKPEGVTFEKTDITPFSQKSILNGCETIDVDSGMGDGTYEAKIGYAENGTACCVVCDFNITSPLFWVNQQ